MLLYENEQYRRNEHKQNGNNALPDCFHYLIEKVAHHVACHTCLRNGHKGVEGVVISDLHAKQNGGCADEYVSQYACCLFGKEVAERADEYADGDSK